MFSIYIYMFVFCWWCFSKKMKMASQTSNAVQSRFKKPTSAAWWLQLLLWQRLAAGVIRQEPSATKQLLTSRSSKDKEGVR